MMTFAIVYKQTKLLIGTEIWTNEKDEHETKTTSHNKKFASGILTIIPQQQQCTYMSIEPAVSLSPMWRHTINATASLLSLSGGVVQIPSQVEGAGDAAFGVESIKD